MVGSSRHSVVVDGERPCARVPVSDCPLRSPARFKGRRSHAWLMDECERRATPSIIVWVTIVGRIRRTIWRGRGGLAP
jgi:hypothetical protein